LGDFEIPDTPNEVPDSPQETPSNPDTYEPILPSEPEPGPEKRPKLTYVIANRRRSNPVSLRCVKRRLDCFTCGSQ
jgi:hypothetical protein